MSRYLSVVVHGAVVLGLAALAAPMLLPNFDLFSFDSWGAWTVVAYGYLLLVVMGAPWSLLWFTLNALGTSDAISEALFLPLVLGGALLNVILSYCWRRRQLRAAVLRVQPDVIRLANERSDAPRA